jgi:hypothetical protein
MPSSAIDTGVSIRVCFPASTVIFASGPAAEADQGTKAKNKAKKAVEKANL